MKAMPLLCARASKFVALFISITGFSAYAQMYSLNSVGYADITFVAGSNLVANPFNAGDNTIPHLFRGVPDGTTFIPWDKGAAVFQPTNRYSSASGWSDPSASLVSPNGGFLVLPSATRVSFAGDIVWTAITNRAGGNRWEVLDRIPQAWPPIYCVSFTDPCPANAPPDGTQFWKWIRAQQHYAVYTWMSFSPGIEPYGWYDPNYNLVDAQLDVGEAGLFWIPEQGTPTTWVRAGMPRTDVAITRAQHTGTNFNFQFSASGSNAFSVLRCTNLATRTWEVIQSGSSTTTVASVNVENPLPGTVFYRLHPQLSQAVVLMNAARLGTTFEFGFYAPLSTNYAVLRKSSLAATSWQTIKTVTAVSNTVVTVQDTAATAAIGYYAIQAAP